jgi:putative tricarboxylic transport membrane protein
MSRMPKRFGWSRPAFLIGFVLSMRLDASVYQSIQVYGWTFLQRPGVLIILALIVVSVYLAARMKPNREPLTPQGPHAPVDKTPQAVFLGLLIFAAAYVIYDVWRLDFLGKVFPLSAAVVTLVLLAAAVFHFARSRPNYIFYDSERDWAPGEEPRYGDVHYQLWILGLIGAIALLGFILGIFVYIVTFLRVKADVRWRWAIVGALGAVALFTVFGHFLVLDYPKGLLQALVDLPWPID